jgi:hypothetical protein
LQALQIEVESKPKRQYYEEAKVLNRDLQVERE